jgi:hypothetical protein
LLGSLASSTPDRSQTWKSGLAAYNECRPLSHDEILAAQALDRSSPILAGCNWIHWVYIEGRIFDDHAQVLERLRTTTNQIIAQPATHAGRSHAAQ